MAQTEQVTWGLRPGWYAWNVVQRKGWVHALKWVSSLEQQEKEHAAFSLEQHALLVVLKIQSCNNFFLNTHIVQIE